MSVHGNDSENAISNLKLDSASLQSENEVLFIKFAFQPIRYFIYP